MVNHSRDGIRVKCTVCPCMMNTSVCLLCACLDKPVPGCTVSAQQMEFDSHHWEISIPQCTGSGAKWGSSGCNKSVFFFLLCLQDCLLCSPSSWIGSVIWGNFDPLWIKHMYYREKWLKKMGQTEVAVLHSVCFWTNTWQKLTKTSGNPSNNNSVKIPQNKEEYLIAYVCRRNYKYPLIWHGNSCGAYGVFPNPPQVQMGIFCRERELRAWWHPHFHVLLQAWEEKGTPN